MFKKPGILFSYNNLYSIQTSTAQSKTSSSHPGIQQQCRSYAMVSDGHSRHNHGRHRWPEVTSANAIPTPYQIFGQKKGSPYSKKRFYELVKQYHPDRHEHSSDDGLSYATKTERYRLVVAANNILSDPVKRGAYDCYGAGWNGAPDVARPRDSSDPSNAWGGRGWGGGPGGPSQNATWEDWERWYQKESKGPQEPRYVSNSAFVGLIMVFAVIGGIGQVTRAGNYGVSFIEQADALNSNISKDLMRRRKETTTIYNTREERIHSFLKQRDPGGYGIITPREETYKRLLPPPDTRSSKGIADKPVDVQDKSSG